MHTLHAEQHTHTYIHVWVTVTETKLEKLVDLHVKHCMPWLQAPVQKHISFKIAARIGRARMAKKDRTREREREKYNSRSANIP